ncbi:HXXEE domain-containing protein [Blastopirellula marina]|uniref:HXXEE domain-containing protein n=1 Tax=Blastopirellula marina TaxID=124 RepID=A0A2S8F428_9BACT|nr:HXXEE domain-containing protein [Blastopirellula marina]PQO26898.1 HXXEE domain-containing protein [Blastopirellula marina]PTL41105.1 HXXEE domain-containing protein [Blastopirellula marina]
MSIPEKTPSPLKWLDDNWPFAGAVAMLFLLGMLPLVAGVWSFALVLVFLQLIVYQAHQLEEHLGDRFRRFVNETVAGGHEALTPRATMWINVGCVWIVYFIALLMAGLFDVGWGLIAVYTMLLNAIAHIAMTLALHRYNPGLWTAIFLFLPIGGFTWIILSESNGLGMLAHVVGLATALAIHIGIVLSVKHRQHLMMEPA